MNVRIQASFTQERGLARTDDLQKIIESVTGREIIPNSPVCLYVSFSPYELLEKRYIGSVHKILKSCSYHRKWILEDLLFRQLRKE